MVEDLPVERVTADRSRHPASLAYDIRLTSFLTLSYCCIATDCACHAPGRAVYVFRSLHT